MNVRCNGATLGIYATNNGMASPSSSALLYCGATDFDIEGLARAAQMFLLHLGAHGAHSSE
jgi:hypothetical protein